MQRRREDRRRNHWPYFVVAIVSGVLITGILGCAWWKIKSNNSKRAKTAADAAKKSKKKKLKKPDAKPLKMKPEPKPCRETATVHSMPDGRIVTYEEYKKLTSEKKVKRDFTAKNTFGSVTANT